MEVNGKKWDPDQHMKNLKKRSEEAVIKREQEKERLKQRILSEWHQHKSISFWTQCFLYVPLKIIKQVFHNVIELKKEGYPVKNESGLFVSIIKKMGYFPWNEGKR